MENKFKKQIERIANNYNVPLDKLDIISDYDDKLLPIENYRIISEKIQEVAGMKEFENKVNIEGNKKSVKEEKELQERIKQENIKKEIEHSETEFKKSLESLKSNSEILDKLYYYPKQYTQVVMNDNNEINSGLFTGKMGQGKSFCIVQALNEEKIPYIYKQGITSPLSLYKFLWEHKSENIIFDDNNSVLTNDSAIGIMLNALYNASGKREISWDSTSGKLDDTPSSFIFEGRIIIITNELPKRLNSDLIKSRCICYNFNFNNYEILTIMRAISQVEHHKLTKEERTEIFKFIEENVSEATLNFDLRVQRTIENLYLFSKENWKELSKPILQNKNEKLILAKKLILSGAYWEDVVKEWTEKTGLSSRQLYRYKEKLMKN